MPRFSKHVFPTQKTFYIYIYIQISYDIIIYPYHIVILYLYIYIYVDILSVSSHSPQFGTVILNRELGPEMALFAPIQTTDDDHDDVL